MTADGGDRYDGAARGWATGAARLYGPLAEALVAASPHPLTGRRVLDAGAGTGLASAALRRRGAHVVALDRSADMLGWDAGARPPAVLGAVEAVPLRDGAVDDVVASFVLNHVDDPTAVLREFARVTAPGGAVLATVAAAGQTTPVRDRIDAVVAAHGFTPPPWYAHLRGVQAPQLGDVAAMRAAARRAGLEVLEVDDRPADPGLERPEDLVDYRLGQAHLATWWRERDEEARRAIRAEALAAVTPVMAPYRPRVVRLVARPRE